MKKTEKISRLLRAMMAVVLAMTMLLCCGCGRKNDEPTNPNTLGDGDGKLEAQDFVDGFTTMYGTMLGAMGGQTDTASRSEMDISVTLGDDLVASLGYLLEAHQLLGDASWLKEFGLGMDMNHANNMTKMILTLRLGDTDIVSAEIIQDLVGQMVYAALPGLNEQYLAAPAEASVGMMGGGEDYAALVSALPTETALNALLTRYLNLVLEHVEEPTVSTETLSYNGISQEVTATTHTIRRSDMLDMAEAVMKAAQTDAELEQMLDKLSDYYNTQGARTAAENGYAWENVDAHQELMDGIEYTLANIAEARGDLEDEDFLQCSVFADGKEQLGIRIRAVDDEDTIEINAYTLRQQENTALLVEVKDQFCFAGTGTEKDGTAGGQYTLSIGGVEMACVEVKGFDTEAWKKGNLKGTVSLQLTEELFGYDSFIMPDTTLVMDLNLAEEGGVIDCRLYNGSTSLLGISIRTKQLPGEAITRPTNCVTVEDGDDLIAWANAIDLQKLLQNLRQAGVPAALVDMLEMQLNGTT